MGFAPMVNVSNPWQTREGFNLFSDMVTAGIRDEIGDRSFSTLECNDELWSAYKNALMQQDTIESALSKPPPSIVSAVEFCIVKIVGNMKMHARLNTMRSQCGKVLTPRGCYEANRHTDMFRPELRSSGGMYAKFLASQRDYR